MTGLLERLEYGADVLLPAKEEQIQEIGEDKPVLWSSKSVSPANC